MGCNQLKNNQTKTNDINAAIVVRDGMTEQAFTKSDADAREKALHLSRR